MIVSLLTVQRLVYMPVYPWSVMTSSLHHNYVTITLSQKGRPYGSGLPCGMFTTEKEGHPKVMKIKLSAQWFLLQPLVPKSSYV